MAISIISNKGKPTYGIVEILLDDVNDLNNLPNYPDPGSTAIVISTGDVYIMNSKHQWVIFG